MTIFLIILGVSGAIPQQFTPVQGFTDLDNSAAPTRFGLLLVAGEDSASNLLMAELILAAVDSLPEESFPDLYVITPDESGYPDVSALCGEYEGYPTTLIMVGHCGYIEMDPCFLVVEIIDAWYTWGDPDTRKTGICNFCRRCNP